MGITLSNIVDDILLTLRNSNIAESEQTNRRHIELLVAQHRAALIKQDIDKGRDINPEYIQELRGVRLIEDISSIDGSAIRDTIRYKIGFKLPPLIDFNFKSGLLAVTDIYGNEIQISNYTRSKFQRNRKWTSIDYLAYLKNGIVYVEGPGELEYINLYIVPENPIDVVDENGDRVCMDPDERYPVPAGMIPIIKDFILKNTFMINAPSDVTNDGKDDTANTLSNAKMGRRVNRN